MKCRRSAQLALAALAAATGLVTGCAGSTGGACDGFLVPGVFLGDFALGNQGRGYLSVKVEEGTNCRTQGVYESFRVDANQREATEIVLPDAPFRIVPDDSGDKAVALGLFGTNLFITQTNATMLPIHHVHDLARAPDGGWVMTSNSSGAWHVALSGAVTPLDPNASTCGTSAGRRYLLCEGNSVAVLGSGGNPVTSLAFAAPVTSIAGGPGAALALWGTSASAISADAVAWTRPLGAPGSRGWIDSAGRNAFVNISSSPLWIQSNGTSSRVLGLGNEITDLLFYPGAAAFFLANGGGNYGRFETLTTMDLQTGAFESPVDSNVEPAYLEPLASGELLLAFSVVQSDLHDGSLVDAVFSFYRPGDAHPHDPWPLRLGLPSSPHRHSGCDIAPDRAAPAALLGIGLTTLLLAWRRRRGPSRG